MIDQILRKLSKALFRGQYGDKMTPLDMVVSPGLRAGFVTMAMKIWNWKEILDQTFRPIVSWKYNIVASKKNPAEIWLEYEKRL